MRAGFRIAGAAELDPDACKTYEGLIGVRPLRVDLSRFPPERAAELWGLGPGEADVLIGTPPCQGFTQLRNGAGEGDPRNRLMLTFLDYVSHFLVSKSAHQRTPAPHQDGDLGLSSTPSTILEVMKGSVGWA